MPLINCIETIEYIIIIVNGVSKLKLDNIEFDAWSSSQIASKIWICNEINKLSNDSLNILILGGWYGILAHLFFVREDLSEYSIDKITTIDIDPACEKVAYRVNKLYEIEGRYSAITKNINDIAQSEYDNINLIINTSSEHIFGDEWWNKIPPNKRVIIQCTNQKHDDHFFCVDTLEELKSRYPMKIEYEGTKSFVYPDQRFERFMIIGLKGE